MEKKSYTLENLEKDYQKFCNERDAYVKRADEIEMIHEDGIVIERINLSELNTFLFVDPRTKNDKVRQSWYGRVLKISKTQTGDEIRELKKARLKIGDIVCYNSDTPYSLNIQGFYGIWVLSIDNIIAIDRQFDIYKIYRETLEKKVDLAF